jgi:type I restriction enzyme S subunit
MNKNLFFKENEFKETIVGKIPKDWDLVSLGNKKLFTIVMGQSPPSSTYNEKGLGLPFLQGKIEFGDIYPSPTIFCSKPEKTAEAKDILLSVRAPVGDVNLATSTNCIGRGISAIRPNEEEINHFYLFYILRYSKKRFDSISSGSTFKAVRKSELERFIIPMPKKIEQLKISKILANIDENIQITKKIIEYIERLKKGLMQELFKKGIGHKEFKETEIGNIPKEWEIVKLGNVLELCQYGLSVKILEVGKYPIIKMDDIVDGLVVPDKIKYSNLDNDTFIHFKLEKGDVLFNRTNSYELVGRTGTFLLDGYYVFASYLIRLKPKKGTILSNFLTFYMNFSNNRLRQLATRAVHQANINATNLKKYKIPLPPLSEQEEICDTISAVDKKLNSERKEKIKLERIKKELMNLLLTGKVRIRVN